MLCIQEAAYLDSAIVPYLLDAVKGPISAFLSLEYDLRKATIKQRWSTVFPRFRSSYHHLGSFSNRTTQADFITIDCYLEKCHQRPYISRAITSTALLSKPAAISRHLLQSTLRIIPGGMVLVLNKVLYRRLHPEVQPLTLLQTFFDRKRYPFRIPSIDKWYPFRYIPC